VTVWARSQNNFQGLLKRDTRRSQFASRDHNKLRQPAIGSLAFEDRERFSLQWQHMKLANIVIDIHGYYAKTVSLKYLPDKMFYTRVIEIVLLFATYFLGASFLIW